MSDPMSVAEPGGEGPDASAGIDPARIDAFYAQAPGASRTNLALAAVAAVVMWDRVPRPVLWGWLAAVALLHGVRLGAWAARRRDPARAANWRRWARRCTLAMLASGLVWGVGALAMFTPAQPLVQAFWLILVAGIGAGVIGANAFHPPAQWAYLVPLLAPVTVRHALEGGAEHGAIAVGMSLYLAFCLVQGRHQARLMRETLATRFENVALVDELRREKAAADAARRAAEESAAARSRFFAAASHDLRQPLHALSLTTGALRAAPLDAERARMAANLAASVEALEALFDELLDISRLDAGAVEPRPAHFPVQRLLDAIGTTFAPVARASGTRLELVPCVAVAYGDEVLLGRIAANFVANALKYAAGGRVAVLVRRRGTGLALQVRDDGPGIPQAERERVFEEFYQLGNPARDRRRGFGLGLATARRIAALAGARLALRSRPGAGSTFEVAFARGTRAQVEAAASAVAPPSEPGDALAGARILVLDDEPDVRVAMRDLLGSWGAHMDAFAGEEEALAALEAAPDAVIADLRLAGGRSGLEAVRVLRERFGAALPALLVSGDTAPERLREAASSGLELLHKPVRPVRLRAALNQVLAERASNNVKA
jgi:signal transduction histidine kinase/CheY-like chemotaxis protein